jgi:hypothetical protein
MIIVYKVRLVRFRVGSPYPEVGDAYSGYFKTKHDAINWIKNKYPKYKHTNLEINPNCFEKTFENGTVEQLYIYKIKRIQILLSKIKHFFYMDIYDFIFKIRRKIKNVNTKKNFNRREK